MTAAKDAANVLDMMVAGIEGRKSEKAATLTPVGTERPQKIDAPFPNDMPTEVMRETRQEINRVIGHLTDAVLAIDAAIGRDVVPAVTTAAFTREVERLADAKFADRFETLKAEAQAATFTTADVPVAAEGAGWTCTQHGDTDLKVLTSRSKRVYRSCAVADCKEFEK